MTLVLEVVRSKE